MAARQDWSRSAVRMIPVIVGLVLLVGACGDGETEAPEAPSTSGSTTTTAPSVTTTVTMPATTSTAPVSITTTEAPREFNWVFTDPQELPVVTLLDPGDEPHKVRTYSYEVGETSGSEVTQVTEVTQELGSVSNRLLIEQLMVLSVEVVEVTERGTVIETIIESVELLSVEGVSREEVDAGLTELLGVQSYSLLSPRGDLLAIDAPASLGVTDVFSNGLAGATAPLPAVPFGVGAVWEVGGSIEAMGIGFVQTTTVRVVGIDGPLLTVELAGVQNLGPDGLVIPGLESAEVDADLNGTISGAAVWDLASPLPVTASSEATQHLVAVFAFEGEEESLDQTTRASFELVRLD